MPRLSFRSRATNLHPGIVATGLLHAMFGAGGAPPDAGARNVSALAARAENVNGLYFDEDRPAEPSLEALGRDSQERLLEATAQMLYAAGVPVATPA